MTDMGAGDSLFRKILIANRGEIALRVIRTCRKMGIETAAVYSDADIESLHVKFADEALHIGPSPPVQSYLNAKKIIEAAKKCDAEAIHPGYGFLAENPDFIRACEDDGITFIGPPDAAVEKLSNKLAARDTMRRAGIPCIPGSEEPIESDQELPHVAKEIGLPLLLKAVYGGGGRGMRIATSVEAARELFWVAQAEAKSAFAKAEVYVEKYLDRPRHVEFQVLVDSHGNIVHLGERECSIQRRHQKLLEEAPSPALDEKLRFTMSEAAIRGLRAARYMNCGTVEFLLDRERNFYFLEINKRLQVEHLITEMTTGVDLVEQQIRIAARERLSFKQDDIRVAGWAVNCRINAEDPSMDFAPTPGKITAYRPPGGPGVRVDSALYQGYSIPVHYDSLVAKMATWGRTRREAIMRMRGALDECVIDGISTTIPVHKRILSDPNFLEGNYDTHFLLEAGPRALTPIGLSHEEAAAISAVVAVSLLGQRTQRVAKQLEAERRAGNEWRYAGRRDLLRAREMNRGAYVEGI